MIEAWCKGGGFWSRELVLVEWDLWGGAMFQVVLLDSATDFSGETGAVLLDSPGWDVLFAAFV